MSAAISIEKDSMKTRLSNIFKTAKVTKLKNAILESSYRVQQVASKWKMLELLVYFLMAIKFWVTFDIQVYITLAIFQKKNAKLHF